MKLSETIVFFGSGPVAAEALELLAQDFEVEAVITKPQPSHHKEQFPVLAVTERLGLKTFTPTNKAELAELFQTRPVSSRLGLVIDYGFIIPQTVIDYFSLGIINSHFSLLPRWRGADPITFSILNGDAESGVSLMLITAGLDEGPLLAQANFKLPPLVTTPELTKELIRLSNQMLQEFVPRYVQGQLKPYPQPDDEPTYSRKLTKADGLIDWRKPAIDIEREIRAYIDWPKSHATIAGKDVVITKATVVNGKGHPGSFRVQANQLIIHCGKNALSILLLKPAGKPEMSAQAFLLGRQLS